ncbi:MAG: sensor histidine kinase, partial [Lachnospiraceae bacterium]
MNRKKPYLSSRIFIGALLGTGFIFLLLFLIWLFSIRNLGSLVLPLILTAAVCCGLFCVYRMIVIPYWETKTIYEQFVKGYVLEDLFSSRYPLTPESELGLQKLSEMIDRNNLIAISKKQAEYLALQNQINPHFLYNTLEGIRSEALIAGLDSIAEMTEALATFFRYTISHMDNLVTLEDELENIENYYYIQQVRFGDKLAMSIQYDHGDDDDFNELEVLQYRLPKLTLQPIVENSIYHGIERKVGKGHLTIRIGVSDERLYIQVSDDGMGMSAEKLKQLNEKLRRLSLEDMESESTEAAQQKRGGIAVVNVN